MAANGPVLVVDDNPLVRALMISTLEDEGYQVRWAEDGLTALRLVLQIKPALILLDLSMPVMDGWSFMFAYQAVPGSHAPVVLVTASRDAAAAARQFGTPRVLAKPFDLAELLALVAHYASLPAAR